MIISVSLRRCGASLGHARHLRSAAPSGILWLLLVVCWHAGTSPAAACPCPRPIVCRGLMTSSCAAAFAEQPVVHPRVYGGHVALLLRPHPPRGGTAYAFLWRAVRNVPQTDFRWYPFRRNRGARLATLTFGVESSACHEWLRTRRDALRSPACSHLESWPIVALVRVRSLRGVRSGTLGVWLSVWSFLVM